MSFSDPASSYEAITKGDTESSNFTEESRGIYVGVGGTVTVVSLSGAEVTFTGVVSGSILPIRAIRVKSTGTAATDMVAIW